MLLHLLLKKKRLQHPPQFFYLCPQMLYFALFVLYFLFCTGNLSNAGSGTGSQFNHTELEVIRIIHTGFFSPGLGFHT